MLFLGTAASAQPVTIQLDAGAFKLTGWRVPAAAPAKGWPSVFAVYAGVGDVPPLLGSYTVEAGALILHPAFPLSPGVRYRAVFRPPSGAALQKIFDGPPKDTTRRTRVERVYPSADVWPSNLLRCYIYFSAPMSRGEADRHIHILDRNGNVLQGVLLPGEELWDPAYRRLTMTFDPGRIKRGLTSNQAMGPPITEGDRYRFVIDAAWPDARGVPMIEGFSKSFRGGPEERNPPDPHNWRITAPQSNTTASFTVDFPTPMNYALLEKMLHITDARNPIPGVTGVSRQETRWSFTPRDPWKAGQYQLVADVAIEDLAGNHIGQPFDVDLLKHPPQPVAAKIVTLPFSIR